MEGKRFIIILTVILVIGLLIVYFNGGIKLGLHSPAPAPSITFSDTSSAQTKPGQYGVSASHPLAVEIGMEVLENGGNAVDAAVAVAYALSVLEPYASGLGGGGVMLVFPADGRPPKTYHYREVVPMSGEVHPLGIGIPGMVKGMEHVHHLYGNMPMEELISPAIQLAEEGFPISPVFAERLRINQHRLDREKLQHFFPNYTPLTEGSILVQKELAQTLRLIRDQGEDAFYKGEIAQLLSQRISTIQLADLKAYQVRESDPAVGRFDGYEIYAPDAPTSGIPIIQALQMLEMLNVKKVIHEDEVKYIHLLGEVIKKVLHDRQLHIADPAYFEVDSSELTSLPYAYQMIEDITPEFVAEYKLDETPADRVDHQNTTHFVVVDSEGMMVSATHTISQTFGSGVYIGGFFLSNQLHNFSTNPASPNYPEPGKSPRTFMAPIILAKEGKPILGIGSAGGKRIPIIIVQVILSALYQTDTLQEAINRPRFHVEENKIFIESKEMIDNLTDLKYQVDLSRIDTPFYFGGVQGLLVDEETQMLDGGADHRRGGAWQAQ